MTMTERLFAAKGASVKRYTIIASIELTAQDSVDALTSFGKAIGVLQDMDIELEITDFQEKE